MSRARIIVGDCRASMATLPDASVDAVVCDPPYELGFMGKSWDASGIAYDLEIWRQALRVLKPGGHLLAFSGSRTYHRMTCAIEDAGFEIRDQIMWVYGSGFPKSLDVSKAIDKAAGAERDAARRWSGWGTALKPAHEPICVARKPLEGTVAANVLKHGTGAVNVDGCRIESGGEHMVKGTVTKRTTVVGDERTTSAAGMYAAGASFVPTNHTGGRWPANFIHDGSEEVLAHFPTTTSGKMYPTHTTAGVTGRAVYGSDASGGFTTMETYGDSGSAARFFYCAKASRSDREEGCDELPPRTGAEAVEREEGSAGTQSPRAGAGRTAATIHNHHPTVKPTDLMRYLVRLVTPPGGTVLDPFTGSGSTGKAAMLEGARFIGCELSPEYAEIARARIRYVLGPLRAHEVE